MNLENIRQYLDGIVRISFDNQRRPLVLEEMSNTSDTSRKDSDLISKTNLSKLKLKEIINEGQTSCPYYSQVTEDEEQRLSPTQPDFETKHTNHQLLVINKEFVVNWKNLTGDFNSKNNKEKRHKFRENHCPKDRDKIINEWKKFIIKKKIKYYFLSMV